MIRLQCQSQSLLNAMVLASLTTFHTATIDGIRVWQEYNIGEARFIKRSEFNLPRKISTSQIMKVTEDNTSPKATFTKMKARGQAVEHSNRKGRAEKAIIALALIMKRLLSQETKLFQCPNYGYVKSFQRFSSLQLHLDVGKHKYVLERKTLLDKRLTSFISVISNLFITICFLRLVSQFSVATSETFSLFFSKF